LSESARKVGVEVRFEIKQIDRLLEEYAGLLEIVRQGKPDLVQMTAVASVLHSFYTGVENILLPVAKTVDKRIPSGRQWHRDLLQQMSEACPNRGPVISAQLARKLVDYLGFRHFYRHSYSFFIDWAELKRLVAALPETWTQAKEEFAEFLQSLNQPDSDSQR